ncbi:MAG: monovalent cation/H(+) antiporter subunit G [Firmicutes bacterium]|nr:monovalent cation/H(+) antiporter subunit G [Bacillota bacterium]MBR6351234.1 monovalent cation/H(+) antiporter subunit G [Bacillota bacterium]
MALLYVVYVLIGLSVFFALAGVVGMLRMPDAFCRMQSSTNIATLGVLGVIIGGIIYAFAFLHNGEMGVKLIVLGVFYVVTVPISGHAIAKGAYHHGVRPEKDMVCDQYGEDLEK